MGQAERVLAAKYPIAEFCIPDPAERDALRAVFRSRGYRKVWILDGSDRANTYYFADGPTYSDELATEMCRALSAVVPRRKAEILPMSLVDQATTELFMDD